MMSARRLRTWRFVQVILIMAVAIVVALDLAARLGVNQIREPVYNRIRLLKREEKEFDDDQQRAPLLPVQNYSTLRVGENDFSFKMGGTKLRIITRPDWSPESLPNWVPGEKEVPVSRFPKALLVGFAKCGTSALLGFLNVHPNIVSLDWEIDYFCSRVYFKYSLHCQAPKGEASLHMMSARRLRTWRFVQVILIMAVAIVAALDLAARLGVNQIREPVYNRIRLLERQEEEFDDDQPLPVQKSSTLKIGEKDFSSKTGGTKLRIITRPDWPPESLPNWVPGEKEVPVSRFPKALLVGFSKCGTSALLSFLNFHPNIVSLDWEIDYFCSRVYFKYSLHWYRMRMPLSTSKQITLEKSPCYGTEPAAMDRILAFNSSIKIMVIVRDPLTRIISHHSQYLASSNVFGVETLSIDDRYIREDGKLLEGPLLKWGTYNERMEHIYAKIPRKQVFVLDGDLFIKNPLPVLKQVERFLGVPSFFSNEDIYMDPVKGFFCPRNRNTKESMCMSENKGRTHVVPSEEFRKKVLNYLRPFSLHFFELVGRRFNWTL